MDNAFKIFIDKQADVMEVVEKFELMSANQKRKTLAYLDEFYEVIRDERRRNLRITEACKP
jgi:hypothetical protein